MNTKPILFSSPLVQAILRGEKTQTRRVINPQRRQLIEFGKCPYRCTFLWVREAFAKAGDGYTYRASYDSPPADIRWTPSIHMPAKASRLRLYVKNARVERLHEITEEDARAEGVQSSADFRDLWDSINGDRDVPLVESGAAYASRGSQRRSCAWAANPWVWVVEWNRIEVLTASGWEEIEIATD